MLDNIRWHGSASFALLNGTHIYINPRRITRPERPADIILIGSAQYDHCSPADIEKLRGSNTLIVGSPSAAAQIGAQITLRPWQSTCIGSVCVQGIPILTADGKDDASGDLGFVISTSRYDIYYTGQTAALPHSGALHPDIIIIPIGGTTNLSQSAMDQMHPRWIVPFGWNGVGRAGIAEAQGFATRFANAAEVVVLEPNP